MRVTMGTIHRNILQNLNRITEQLNLVNGQISSGRRLSKPSDNPVDLAGALGLRTTAEEIKQYQRNLLFGDHFIRSSENALRQINDLTVRAKELAIQAANAVVTPRDRANMAMEARHLFEQAVMLANTQVNGKFIFAGYRTSGYTNTEPVPFIEGLDSHYRANSSPPADIALAAGDLLINGIALGAAGASVSDKAGAINAIAQQTGVEAKVNPLSHQAGGPVQAGALGSGDLRINGIDIFTEVTSISGMDSDSALLNAINQRKEETGVTASRDAAGHLILTAVDGYLQIETTANGEAITGLASQTYHGTLQLFSLRSFTLQSTTASPEEGLAALGLTGDNGLLTVHELARREGSIRYAGDPDHDLEIKVGARSTLAISKNGQDALMDTGVFSVLKRLENFLLGQNYTELRNALPAADITRPLAEGGTGLPGEGRIVKGQFTVTITDHEQAPPADLIFNIGVDPEHDSLEDIAARLNGLPGLAAAWDAAGHLVIEVTDKERYSVALADDSSLFLQVSGFTGENMQFESLEEVIAELELLMDKLNHRISDFGARGNRIDAQNQIWSNLGLAVAENLSQLEETDLIKAFMDLKAKEIAYQSALAAAAKTMQLSLMNYL
jgi:flagellin-like hook-associated protein FlgL